MWVEEGVRVRGDDQDNHMIPTESINYFSTSLPPQIWCSISPSHVEDPTREPSPPKGNMNILIYNNDASSWGQYEPTTDDKWYAIISRYSDMMLFTSNSQCLVEGLRHLSNDTQL